MQALRTTSSRLTRLVLAWFVAVLVVAGTSPLVQPVEFVCTPDGLMKSVVVDADGELQAAGAHALDCSLCLPAMLAPVPRSVTAPMPQPLAHALLPAVAAHIAALVGAPLPPRGPPAQA